MLACVAAVVGDVLLGRMPRAIGRVDRSKSVAVCGLPECGHRELGRDRHRQGHEATLSRHSWKYEAIDVVGDRLSDPLAQGAKSAARHACSGVPTDHVHTAEPTIRVG